MLGPNGSSRSMSLDVCFRWRHVVAQDRESAWQVIQKAQQKNCEASISQQELRTTHASSIAKQPHHSVVSLNTPGLITIAKMRFTIPLLAIVAATVLANPAPTPNASIHTRDNAEVDLIADFIIFGVESAKCRIFKCAKLVATGACILTSLPDITQTLAYVKGNVKRISLQFSIKIYR
jgi:hypothetical protein